MSVDLDSLAVRNNETEKRFEVEVNGQMALLEYIRAGQNITYTHTEVPVALKGMGIGGKLARHALEFARDNDLKVIPICPFVTSYLRTHPEFHHIVFGYKGKGSSA
ncbi:GNAT family N-acetyltransferase [Candidatus Leptofilum sp.]|uniref:GNAT family N-acetyltransferase n=1 Tax=Candidatus Leptofilum sp. TaxID=3241576 RepID=UPI003B59BCCC